MVLKLTEVCDSVAGSGDNFIRVFHSVSRLVVESPSL